MNKSQTLDETMLDRMEKLKYLIELSSDAFTLWDSNLNLIDLNESTLKYFPKGTKQEDLIGKNIAELIPEDKESGRYNQYLDVMKSGRTLISHDHIFKTKQRKTRLVIKAFKAGDGLGMIARDITKPRRVEQELQEYEERLNILITKAPNAILSFDTNGQILFVNKKTEEITGYTREELIGGNILDPRLLPNDYLPQMTSIIEKHKAGEVTEQSEFELITKDGDRIFIEAIGVPTIVRDKSEIFVIAKDITRRKLAEKKAGQLETVLRSIRQANISSSSKKNVDLVLKQACNQLVETRKYHNAWIALFDETDNLVTHVKSGVGQEFKSILNRLKTGNPPKCVQSTLDRSDVVISENPLMNCCECPLSMLYYGMKCMSVRFKYNNGYGVITASLASDLTSDEAEQSFFKEIAEYLSSALHTIDLEEERKLMEGALRDSEEKHRLILENLNEGIWQIDADGFTTFANPSMAQMLGYTPEEMLDKHLFTYMDEAGIQRAKDLLERRGRSRSEQHDFEFVKKDGSILYARLSTSPVKSEDDKYIGAIAGVQDITERKLAEEEKERLLREVNYRAKELACLYGISNVLARQDASPEELFQGILELIPPAYQYPDITCARITIEGKRYKTENFKKTEWIQAQDINAHGERVGTVEICYLKERPEAAEGPFLEEERHLTETITGRLGEAIERKRAKEALRESEQRLSQIIEESTIPTFVINKEHIVTHWNKACENLTGISKDQVHNTKNQWKAFYDKESPVMADLIVDKASEKVIAKRYGENYRKS
ncbi:MAG: PAS domain S-box protein, partial [Chloroflexota bacterium]|nr:PAS domain S-box protein [Chloroflexota bacterium]